MLDILQPARRLCDGVARRDFFKIGALGAFGLSLADVWRAEAAGSPPAARRKSCILLWLQGGPSQIDTFDPKPEQPEEIRGPFAPIETNVSGIRIADPFPLLARTAHRYALIRSVHHPAADHGRTGHQWMLCGRSSPSIAYPSLPAVISRLRGGGSLLPAHVAIPNLAYFANVPAEGLAQTGGVLGEPFAPVVPEGTLGGPDLRLPNTERPAGIGPGRARRRRDLLSTAGSPGLSSTSEGRTLDGIQERAFQILDSGGLRQAFDLTREPERMRDRYGRNPVGACALLARRLVEQDVRFVTVNWPNYYEWDNHADIEGAIGHHLGPTLDRALSALLQDLDQRGLLETTLVVAMGEMGRTPKMGAEGGIYGRGRGHWGGVLTVLLAGGGVRGGQVIGASDEQGAYPAARAVSPADVAASIYHVFGIRASDNLPVPGNRVLDQGDVIQELF
ncbi:MAG: DUF1501 domain-containing protein [Armatimonadetes bacterium]|nr:DUF1501 domain-containing protein [Armatimonadota bacterium]